MHDCTHGGNTKTDKPKTTADNNAPLIQVSYSTCLDVVMELILTS